MILQRPPGPALRPFVSILWAKDASPAAPGHERELILPKGAMHVAIRLRAKPLRLFASPGDVHGQVVGACVLNGVRLGAYAKENADSAASVGAMLRPGAADLLSNTPAGALAGRHTRLEDLWPAHTLADACERLEAARSLEHRLAILEDVLASRLPALRGTDPLVVHALARFDAGASVGDVVAESGFSHRHVVRVFTEAVGAAPKAYMRLGRFNRTLELLRGAEIVSLADVATAAGYADQSHMTREFRDFAGMSPGRYLRTGCEWPHHVPVTP
ncbi:AraC family transcriptional regulator [Arenibaculum sp.]|jgi:AraC-like DNA-binding protein|uniref:AraC family transcriptional regulator n=1 Tax=Arenibaculum sp. TaxID=2865862 RepID=UPI002E1240FF|nr:AraC family transcriptional regulator [Arenibaculum sp.]